MSNKKLLGVGVILLLLIAGFGCNTAKYREAKATKFIAKAFKFSKKKVGEITRDSFPCITTNADTTINTYDTTYTVNCRTVTKYLTDSLVEYIPVQVQGKVVERIITLYKKDSAEYYLFHETINDLDKQLKDSSNLLTQYRKTIKDQSDKISHKNKWLWIYRGVILLFLVAAILLAIRTYKNKIIDHVAAEMRGGAAN